MELASENIQTVPELEGAIQVLNENQEIILIQGTANLRLALEDQLKSNTKACYLNYYGDPMYTKRESELFQQFMQEFGRFPEDNVEFDDLF